MPRLATRRINSSLKSSGSLVVAISSNASINVLGDASTTKYSWGCRAKLTPDNAAATVFFSKASAKYSLQLRIETGGKVRAAIYDGVNNPVAQSANTYTDNEWHTFIGVRDGTSLKLYIDGSLAGSTTSTINDCDESSGISMFGNGTKGVFSEGFVTLTAMTATEVMNHEINNTLPVSCLAILPCNEGAGSIAYDTSGNANNGTITSPTWTRDAPSKTRKAVNGNLVFNGDFEIAPPFTAATTGHIWIDGTAAGSSNALFGWVYYNWTGTHQAQFDTSVKRIGNASMKISTLSTGSTIGLAINADSVASWRLNNIPVLPSTSYTASLWMKTQLNSGSATTGARYFIQEYNGTGATSVTTTNVVTGVVTTTDWTYYTLTFTTNSATRYINPKISINGNDGAATLIMDAWFDDITLTPTTATTRTALTKSRVKIQEDNYSVQWPTLTSGSGVATASAAMQTLGVSNLNYSAGIWVKELSKRLTFGNIIFRLTAATPFRYAFQIVTFNTDRFSISFYDGTLNPGVSSPKSYPIGSWYHVAFTREGTTVKIYVNGVLSATSTITIGTTASNSVGLGVNNAFAGNVSDAFIYGSVLTADEIYAIYANDVYPSGALLKAKLNDGTGTTAADQSGNGVDFTLTTPTWSTDTATGKRTVVS
jgi:hypothetical protein